LFVEIDRGAKVLAHLGHASIPMLHLRELKLA